jgi:hypothetical protein
MMPEMIVTTMIEMPMMNRIESNAILSGGSHDMPLDTADHCSDVMWSGERQLVELEI